MLVEACPIIAERVEIQPILHLANKWTSIKGYVNVEGAIICILPQTFEITLLILLEERCVDMLFYLLVRSLFFRQVVRVLAHYLRLSL